MRTPHQLASPSPDRSDGMRLVCLLANIIYIFGEDELNPQEVEDRLLDIEAPYRKAGELTLPLFLLRENNFTVYAIGQTALTDRIGSGASEWFGDRLNEDSRLPTLQDINAFVHDGWAVIATLHEGYGTDIVIPAPEVLIAGPDTPMIYSPDGDGIPHLYNWELFQPHWDIHRGIIAVRP